MQSNIKTFTDEDMQKNLEFSSNQNFQLDAPIDTLKKLKESEYYWVSQLSGQKSVLVE